MASDNQVLNKTRLADLLKTLPRLKVFDEQLREYEEAHPFEPSLKIVDKNSYVGIEVEVENLQLSIVNTLFWTKITDGSLRNFGAEFITNPIRAWRVEHALNHLFDNVNKDIDFSHRTSIHIHLNIRTLTMDEIRSFVLLYILFEKSLFNFVSPERYENIFCVPLNEIDLTYRLNTLFEQPVSYMQDWDKYTALNLNPISTKGTIEFRHLRGTKDIPHIINWLNLILCLKIAALKHDPESLWKEVQELNSSSRYEQFGMKIFHEYFHLINNPNYKEQISSSISHSKACCLPNKYNKANSIHENIPEEVSEDTVEINTLTPRPRGGPLTGWGLIEAPIFNRETVNRILDDQGLVRGRDTGRSTNLTAF